MYRSRLGKNLGKITLDYVSSLNDDVEIALYDILGSQAHVIMLYENKIITKKEIKKILKGLENLKKEKFQGGIIVMDADGQDDPEYLVDIIKESKKNPERTITINRTKRDDELLFKILYQMYLFLSFLLTFKYLKFGVYSYLHSSSLDKILSTNDIHLAYAASLAKHFKNRNVIFAPRKKRILGQSQNNYKSLTHYALKIISVFKNQVLVNSAALVFISFLLSKFIASSVLFLFILLALLFFNVIIFLLTYQINKSHIIKDTLMNIENIENLRN